MRRNRSVPERGARARVAFALTLAVALFPIVLAVGAADGAAHTVRTHAVVRVARALRAPTVVLYGDSLGVESEAVFRSAFGAAGITDVHTETYGGTALCDWFQRMRDDAVDLRPDVVVIEFSGNAFTPCMHDADGDPLTGESFYTKYATDAGEALRIFAATAARVYLVGTPISRRAAEAHGPNAGRLNARYSEIADLAGAGYIDAGAAVLDHGRWTATLPCLQGEPCTGDMVNLVRAPDGMRFCPTAGAAVQGVTGVCAGWSSGAYRFGTAMAAPVIDELRRQRV